MEWRSVLLGGKHVHHIFLIPIEKGLNPHVIDDVAITNILQIQ